MEEEEEEEEKKKNEDGTGKLSRNVGKK